jgi:hypothetical protein
MKYEKVTNNRYMVISNNNQFVCWLEKDKTSYSAEYIVTRRSFSFNSLEEAKEFIERNPTLDP